MNVLTRPVFEAAAANYPQDASALWRTYDLLRQVQPQSFQDLKAVFSSLDLFKHRAAENWVVIDVGGNNLRLIGGVNYARQFFYTKHIYTHAEYDKANAWYAKSSNKGVRP